MGNAKNKESNVPDLSRSTRVNRIHNDKDFLHGDFFSCFILSEISVRDFFAIRCTCKTWLRILDDERNWKEIALKKFGPSTLEYFSKNNIDQSCQSRKELCQLRYYLDFVPKAYLEAATANLQKKKKEKKSTRKYNITKDPARFTVIYEIIFSLNLFFYLLSS